MGNHTLRPSDELHIKIESGRTFYGNEVPDLGVIVTNRHSISISDFVGTKDQSAIEVFPLRLNDGTLRREASNEPKFHKDAHYLIRISDLSSKDNYHQFDNKGNCLG